MKQIIWIAGFILFCGCFSLNAQTKNSGYRIANKFPLEGDGFWDYLAVDQATGRLFVSHGTMVQVIHLADGKLAGTIPDTKGVHGIAIAADLNKAFISNGRDSSVTVVDLKTLSLIVKVAVTGRNPDAILYDSFSHKVFVYNGRTANATVIDAVTNKVIETIKLEGKPEFSVTDGKGKIYVNIEDKNLITMINAATLKVEQNWPIAPGDEPSGLALDNENHRLFAVCGNKMMVIVDALNGKVITTIATGVGTDGAAFDPGLKRAYSSNGEGTLTVVQEEAGDVYKLLENVATQRGARTIALDKVTHHLYLPTAEFEAPKPGSANSRPSLKPGTFVVLEVVPVK